MISGDSSYNYGIYSNNFVLLAPNSCYNSQSTCTFANYSCDQMASTTTTLTYNSTLYPEGFNTQISLFESGSSSALVIFLSTTDFNSSTDSTSIGYGVYILTSSGTFFDPTIGLYTAVVQISPTNIIAVSPNNVLTQYIFNFTTNSFAATTLPTLTIPFVNALSMNRFSNDTTLLIEALAYGYSNYYINTDTMEVIDSSYAGSFLTFANGSVVDLSRLYSGSYSISSSNSIYTYNSPPNYAFSLYDIAYIANTNYLMQFNEADSTGCNLISFAWASNQVTNVTIPGCNFDADTNILAVSSNATNYYVITAQSETVSLYSSTSGLVGQVQAFNSTKPNLFIDTVNNLIWWYDFQLTNVYYLNNFSLHNSTNYSSNFQNIYKVSDAYAIGININQSSTAGTFSVISGTKMTITQNFTWPYTATLTSSSFSPMPLAWSNDMQKIEILMFQDDANYNLMDTHGNTKSYSSSGWMTPISQASYTVCSYLPDDSYFMTSCNVYNLPDGDEDDDDGGISGVAIAGIILGTIFILGFAVYVVMRSKAAIATKTPIMSQGIAMT